MMKLNIKIIKKVFKKVAQEAESDYYKMLFDAKTNSVKQLWYNLNTVCAFKKRKTRANIAKLVINNQEVTDNTEISNNFNTFLVQLEKL